MIDLSQFDNLSEIEFNNMLDGSITEEDMLPESECNKLRFGINFCHVLARGKLLAFIIEKIFRIKSDVIEFVTDTSHIIKSKDITVTSDTLNTTSKDITITTDTLNTTSKDITITTDTLNTTSKDITTISDTINTTSKDITITTDTMIINGNNLIELFTVVSGMKTQIANLEASAAAEETP